MRTLFSNSIDSQNQLQNWFSYWCLGFVGFGFFFCIRDFRLGIVWILRIFSKSVTIVVLTALPASIKNLWLEAIGGFVTSLFLLCAMYAKVFSSHHSFFTVVYFVVVLTQFQRAEQTFSEADPSLAFFFFFIKILGKNEQDAALNKISKIWIGMF